MTEEQIQQWLNLVDAYAEAAVKLSKGDMKAFEEGQAIRNEIAAGLRDAKAKLDNAAK